MTDRFVYPLGGVLACLALSGCLSTLTPQVTPAAAGQGAVRPTLALGVVECDRLAASPLDPQRPAGVEPVRVDQIPAQAAIEACTADLAMHGPHPRLQVQLGVAHLQANQPDQAFQSVRLAADQGYAYAQYLMGLFYENGIGVARDLDDADRWYRLAAASGMTGSWTRIGIIHLEKRQPPNQRQAIAAFRQAAQGGDVAGMTSLGHVLRGSSRSSDQQEAVQWLQRAAASGNVNAMRMMGEIHWAKKDFKAALPWYRQAAEAGHAPAQYTMGHYYILGHSGVTQDVPRAMALYEQAARAGHLPAAESLAMNYLSGERVPYDEAKAMSWLRFGMPTPSAMPVAATGATHACNRRLAWGDISPAVARAGGLAEQSGYYVLDAQQLAQRAGGPEQLLALSREQINSNLKWFDHMAPIAVRPTTPLQPQVQALYQQAYETHEVELAIRHAMECLLGLTPSPPQRPARLDELKRDANAQAARQREREASAAAGSGFVNFLNALGGALRATAGSGGGGGASPGSTYCTECAVGRPSR